MYWRGDKSEFLQDCKEFLETNRMWSGRAEGVYVDFHEHFPTLEEVQNVVYILSPNVYTKVLSL